GFGGAFTLANIIHKDSVEKKKWISEIEFKHGLAFTQFSPGPLITQVAIYIGFLKQGIIGATVAGLSFIFTPLLLVLIISIFYSKFGNMPWMREALYGIGASVIGIICSSVISLIAKTIKKKIQWTIVVIVFLVSFLTGQTNYILFIAAGLIAMFLETKKMPKLFAIIPLPILPLISNSKILWQLFIFFFSAGSVAFGGGLAILPYLQTGVVSQYHWLTNKQFLDAVAVAMITPGPVVITSVFIGYLVAGFPGAFFATLGMFLPVYLIVITLTPLVKKHAENMYVMSFVDGVIAAAMGAICGAIIILGKESLTDYKAVMIALISFIIFRFLKIQSVFIILTAGIIGVLLLHFHF
ncbi:MAG TPA: chromate efflux transporter, partial [Patescibacteria group bacterium]